jgi:flagellar motor switch protein FliN
MSTAFPQIAEMNEVAYAFAAALPGPFSIDPVDRSAVDPHADSWQASFVGERPVDFAVVLHADALTRLGIQESFADILRPALEHAAEKIGPGLVGEVAYGASRGIAQSDDATCFSLTHDGQQVGWFVVAMRPARPSATGTLGNLSRIAAVEMTLTVEIGRTRIPVRDLLALEPGSIVELDRSVGSPATVLVNGKLIAYGEVVIVDQDYAVRVTSVIDTQDVI